MELYSVYIVHWNLAAAVFAVAAVCKQPKRQCLLKLPPSSKGLGRYLQQHGFLAGLGTHSRTIFHIMNILDCLYVMYIVTLVPLATPIIDCNGRINLTAHDLVTVSACTWQTRHSTSHCAWDPYGIQ